MAKKKKMEFRPDPQGSGLISKLYIPAPQRRVIYRWCLYSLAFVLVLVVQDVILSRFPFLGGMAELAPAVIVLVCVMEGADSGGVFALCASIFYLYSGSGGGAYCILLLTAPAVLVTLFRQGYLRRGFASGWLCSMAALAVYQAGVFAMGLFFGSTYPDRWLRFVMNWLLSGAGLPLVYPLLSLISRIGGDKWKE